MILFFMTSSVWIVSDSTAQLRSRSFRQAMQESADRDGVEMIFKQMQQVLENAGLQEIEAEGAVSEVRGGVLTGNRCLPTHIL